MNLSKPTILYHIKILENAGHVRKIEDGRKWIYYELTDSGKYVLRWRKVKVILPVIGAAITAIIAVAVLLRPKKEVPKYPAMSVDLTGLLVSIALITVFASSLIVIIYFLRKLSSERF